MPGPDCWQDIFKSLGQLQGRMELLTALDKKMDDCIDICQTGHNRITRCEEKLKAAAGVSENHEMRISNLEKATPLSSPKTLAAIVLILSVVGSWVFEVVKASDIVKLVLAH